MRSNGRNPEKDRKRRGPEQKEGNAPIDLFY